MLFEIFEIGAFWFWLLVLFEFCVLINLLETEKYEGAIGSLIGCIIFVLCFGSGIGDIIKWTIANPLYFITIVIGYFVVGTIFVAMPFFGKWALFVKNIRDKNREVKKQWLAKWKTRIADVSTQINQAQERLNFATRAEEIENINQELSKLQKFASALENCNGIMTENLLPFWKEYENVEKYYDFFDRCISIKKPEPGNFKGRIIAWIVYWPPIMFWTLLNDPLRYIGRMIYDVVAKMLKRISDSAWKDEDKV